MGCINSTGRTSSPNRIVRADDMHVQRSAEEIQALQGLLTRATQTEISMRHTSPNPQTTQNLRQLIQEIQTRLQDTESVDINHLVERLKSFESSNELDLFNRNARYL